MHVHTCIHRHSNTVTWHTSWLISSISGPGRVGRTRQAWPTIMGGIRGVHWYDITGRWRNSDELVADVAYAMIWLINWTIYSAAAPGLWTNVHTYSVFWKGACPGMHHLIIFFLFIYLFFTFATSLMFKKINKWQYPMFVPQKWKGMMTHISKKEKKKFKSKKFDFFFFFWFEMKLVKDFKTKWIKYLIKSSWNGKLLLHFKK